MKKELSERDKCLSGYRYRQTMTLQEYKEWMETAPEHKATFRRGVVVVQFGEVD